MKKLAIAAVLTAMATTVSAQTVTVYGKMRIFMEQDTVGTASAVTKQTNEGSRLGFRGTEDLGNGLKANFVLETGVDADAPSASTLGSRVSTVGLSNQFGYVNLGRDKHQLVKTIEALDILGGGYGSSVYDTHSSQGSRLNNGVYAGVNLGKNVKLHADYATSEVAGTPAVKGFGAQANLGPLTVMVANYDNGLTSESTAGGASLKLGSKTTLVALYSDNKISGADRTGKSVGVIQQITPTVSAQFGYGEHETSKSYNAGLTYNLSKRTMIHARFRDFDHDTNSSDRKQIALGLETNF